MIRLVVVSVIAGVALIMINRWFQGKPIGPRQKGTAEDLLIFATTRTSDGPVRLAGRGNGAFSKGG